MKGTKTRHNWETFLKFYSEENKGRKTRLGAFEADDKVFNDYWLENGLPLVGVDIDLHGGLPAIEIILEGFSHIVADAVALTIHYSLDGIEDGLDIRANDSNTTVLRFAVEL